MGYNEGGLFKKSIAEGKEKFGKKPAPPINPPTIKTKEGRRVPLPHYIGSIQRKRT